MKFPFSIKPIHWWYYFNPFWWQRKQKLEKFFAYAWDTYNIETKFNAAILEAILYGEGRALLDWKDK